MQRLRKALILIVLISGVPPPLRAPLSGGGEKSVEFLKTIDSSMTDSRHSGERAKLCQEKPLVMLGSLAVMRTLLAISIFKVVDLGLVA